MTNTTMPRARVSFLVASLTAVLIAGMPSVPVRAATSFPDYPLQSGAGTVPPNILFVLDNSGSMQDFNMNVPGAENIAPINFRRRARVTNSLAYDPAVTYAPWDAVDSTGASTVVPGGTSYSAAYQDDFQATNPGTIGDRAGSVFYVLRSGQPANASTSYDRYRINGSGTVVKASVTGGGLDYDQNIAPMPLTNPKTYSSTASISIPGGGGYVQIFLNPVGASGDADMYVTTDGSTPSDTNYQCKSDGGSASEYCELELFSSATVKIRVQAYQATGTLRLQVASTRMGTESAAVPPGSTRSNAAEATNIATWYSFHHTRIKVAKAGASRAFVGLGAGFRVGYDTINNDDGSTNTAARPRYPIPVGTNSGRFEAANKVAWFTQLQSQTAVGGTPLRTALNRAGQYFQTAAPWTDGDGTQEQACRASYSLLSTDGLWNEPTFTIGDVDGDTVADTLADVAKFYWQTDLRPALPNAVPTSSKDSANWQHMGLFGVSIGQQGTLTVSDTPPSTWPNPMIVEDERRIDDLWHASVNARGTFIVASQADQYAKALKSALDNIKEQVASGSNVTANGISLQSDTQLFAASFTSRAWAGEMRAYAVANKRVATSPSWSLSTQANTTATNFVGRPVMTWYNNAGAPFDTAHVPSANAYVRAGTAAVTAADNIAYLKGDRSKEQQNGGVLRDRRSPIGDIVDSSPAYEAETGMVFVGANDGMLHGIDADTGNVLFSYVPAGVDIPSLASLSDPYYYHHFFVDGQISVSTVAQGSGKNILVGALGRGGKGVFALDVTGVKGSATGFAASDVLWDRTAVSDNDMGYVLGRPLVLKGNNGSTLVIIGNGVESTNGKAVLYVYVLDAAGAVTSTLKFDTGVAGGNGMSEPRAADADRNGTVDTVYAGDLKGNLWKLNLSSSSTSSWGFSYTSGSTPLPMFTAKDPAGNPQPITAAVALTREPGSGRIFVNFGTGKFLSQSDVVTQSSVEQTQTLYALIDNGTRITSNTQLQQRTIPYVGVDSEGRTARGFETYSALPAAKLGWYLNLATNAESYGRGERVVSTPRIDGRESTFSSIIPNLGEGCANTGKGFLNKIDVFTGTNPMRGGYFDINRNGRVDDKVSVSGAVPTGSAGYVSSVDLNVGLTGQASVLDDYTVVQGSNGALADVLGTRGTDTPQRLNWRELINRQ